MTADTGTAITPRNVTDAHHLLDRVHVHDRDLTTMEITLGYAFGPDKFGAGTPLPDDLTAAGAALLETIRATEQAIKDFRTLCYAVAERPCLHTATDQAARTTTVRRVNDNSLWTYVTHLDRWITPDTTEGPLAWAELLTTGDVVTVTT